MSLNKYQSKEESDLISSEYDRYRGETIDKIDDLLQITQQSEMDSKIHKNCLAILKILKNVQNKLYNNYELEKEEIENFIYCLKFLDTLNIFMSNSMIDTMMKLNEEITNLLHSTNQLKYKDDLLHKIKYAEKSVVYFKKKIFKSLYFSDPTFLSKEIEKSLLNINQSYEYSNNFDRKIFKQLQNIFWVLQKRLNEEQKIFLQKLIDDLKGLNFKSRSRRYNSYYDYNDYNDSQNYYSFNNYNNTNNYYSYSNYNNSNSNQHRRCDYYDPYYKKTDLIELPEIIHNPIKMEDETNSSQFKNSDKNPEESFTYNHDQIKSEKLNDEYNHKDHDLNDFSNHLNKSQNQDQEKLDDIHKIIGFQNESKTTNFNYNRGGYDYKARNKNRNLKVENTKDLGQNISDLKFAENMESSKRNNQISQDKIYQNEVQSNVIDDFGRKAKFNSNECNNEIENFNSFEKINDIQNMTVTTYNKDNIEKVIVSNINEKEFSNYNKNFNSYFGNNNSKSNKKQKEYHNQNYYFNSKPEKDENKSSTKKSKKLKSHSHLLVEVDYSKIEREKIINNEQGNIQKENLLREKDNELNDKSKISEIDNLNVNEKEYLTDTAKETKPIDEKYEKDNIEIIRNYQSDFEYNKEYNSAAYGKYNSKYYKNYQNLYTKQNSTTKNYKNSAVNSKTNDFIKNTECNIADSKLIDSITPTQKIIDEDIVVSNFNSVSANPDKENSSSFNSKSANVSINNTKFKNKTYSTYNAYNFGGYNNHKIGNQVGKEKIYSDKEYLLTIENEKKNKYVIKEVEFSDKKNEANLPNTESIQMEINKFINNQDNLIFNDDKKNNEEKEDFKILSSIMKNNDSVSFDNQLIKSNSDLAANLNDLKFMNLKVNIENFPHSIDNNENIEKNKKDEKLDEINMDKNESNNTKYNEITYEKVSAIYNNNHSRFNVSNNNYRGNTKNKISKHGKFQQHINTNFPHENSVNTMIDNNDKYSKNFFNNSKQTFNYTKEHSNNFSGKNYNNNLIESNNFNQNKNNINSFYEKANYSTYKKKSYVNNYNKHEKNYDVSAALNFDETIPNIKVLDIITKDDNDADYNNMQAGQLETLQIESNNKEMPLKDEKELVNINDSNDKILENKHEDFNDNNKGYFNNFNSLNNNIETREIVYNKNYYENHSKNFNKEYSNTNNMYGNTNQFIMNKNNTYIKQQRGSNINNNNNDNEIYQNFINNNQENLFNKNSNHFNNYNEIKTKNKRHLNAFESNYYDSKAYENSKISQNPTTNYFYNQVIETENNNHSRTKGKEEFYDFSNQNFKLKNKKGKNSKINNINIRGNNNLIYNQNTNYTNNEQLLSCMFNNANISTQTKYNNINSNLNINPINNYTNQSCLQNTINKKPSMNYNYNSTDIGLFNNIMGMQNKTNQNYNNVNMNNSNFLNSNPNMTSNLNMFNYNLMNYIAQMNYLNKINPLNIISQNNIINNQNYTFDNQIENQGKSKIENFNDLKNEESEIKIQDSQNTISKPANNLQVKDQELKPEEFEDKIKNKIEIIQTDSAATITHNNEIKNNINKTITSPKEHKTIGVFNMDIEKFFQSDAKNINFNNISHLEKKESNIQNSEKSITNEVVDNLENSELIPTINQVQNSFKLNTEEKNDPKENKEKKLNNNFKQKYDLVASENETEKELLNNNSYEEENESDEEPYSDSSESIANEEIDAAFETFQNEIRQINSLPIASEEDDDYYIAESDYIDEDKGKRAKNNKAIFEEGNSNNELLNLKLETGKIDSSSHEKINAQIPFKKEENLNKVCIGSDEEDREEDEDEEEELSDTDLLRNPDAIVNNQIKEIDEEIEKEGMQNYLKNANIETPINNSKNAILADNFGQPDKSSKNAKAKNIINNQIFNNFNFYNMQMLPNPNMIQYLRNMSTQKGQANISPNTLNLINMMENSKMMNFNLPGIKNTNNLGMNQSCNSNIFFSAQQNQKSLREQTKSYSESVKTIDPDLLKIIKNKLTENTNTQANKESVNSSDQLLPASEDNSKEDQAIKNQDFKEIENSDNDDNLKINHNKEVKQESKRNTVVPKKLSNSDANDRKNSKAETNLNSLENNQGFTNNYSDSYNNLNTDLQQFENVIVNANQLNNSNVNKNSLFQNSLMSNWSHFIFRGRDSNIHRDYLTLKYIENENPYLISRNIEGFENRILIPIYQKLIFNVNKKKGVYFFTFNKYRKIICKVLQNSKILKKVKPYGSLMNNFMIDSGDIDICIVPNCSILEFAIYLDKIKEELISQNVAEHKLTHHTSRYMLLKVQDNQTKFTIDITVHNMLPILNTKLIRLYSIFDQRFHILGLYLKHWSKINKIHGAADNYLSSYALLVMLIYFLQKVVEPKVLPNLQKVEDKETIYEYIQNGENIKTNIYFEEDISKIKENLKIINSDKENVDSASSLLIKFFEFYSYNYDFYEQKISISKDASECYKTKSDTIAFSIDDPFDNFHNPGKSMTINSTQFNKFITAMKKEVNFILNGEYLKRLDKITSISYANTMNLKIQMQMQNMNNQINPCFSNNNNFKQNHQ